MCQTTIKDGVVNFIDIIWNQITTQRIKLGSRDAARKYLISYWISYSNDSEGEAPSNSRLKAVGESYYIIRSESVNS